MMTPNRICRRQPALASAITNGLTSAAAIILVAALSGCAIGSKQTAQAGSREMSARGVDGFKNTPMEPDGKWHVHDPDRPQPVVVTPGAFSTQKRPGKPPSDAIVLFDGKDLSKWRAVDGKPAPWILKGGAMIAARSDIVSTQEFGDIQLHVEFCEPAPGKGEGQGRGNSGVFLMNKYEVQVLDCYESRSYADGSTGGLYGQHPPLVNACRPPGQWQTYDIVFNPPHFDAGGKLLSPVYITVLQNGIVVQNHQSYHGPTGWKNPGHYEPQPPTGPIGLQFHHDPVRYRNIWVRPIEVPTDE